MQLIIRAIGREKDQSMLSLCKEYMKRIPWSLKIEEFEANNEIKEGEMLLSKLAKNSYIYVLDEHGQQHSSIEFAEHLTNTIERSYNSIYFMIGGASGHHKNLLNAANHTLSLSKMTFPHKMVRYILLEQVYRAFTISQNHPYHK